MRKVAKMTNITMLLAMAIIFHMVESMIPLPLPVPGIKLGLANIVGLIAFYYFGAKEMLSVNVLRVIFASLLRGMIFGVGFWLSLGGVLLSSIMAIAFRKVTKMSIVGISVCMATFHCIGQILVVVIFYGTPFISYWLPIMLYMSIPTGILTGVIAKNVLKKVKKESF